MNYLAIIPIIFLALGLISALIIGLDILSGHRQPMMVMNFVYPLSALYAGPLAVWFYYQIGRKPGKKPFWQSVAIGALHCGSGCTVGDVMAEGFLLMLPVTIFGSKLAGTWTIDFVFAFVIGIIFQYYAIKPMRKIAAKDALVAALKADTLSLTCWQIGMYGWMAVCFFVIFGHRIPVTKPLFWFMMQIAMLFGFLTAYPVNWWLIKKGIKEAM
ncbi:DUF4396 domain-containing protein [Mucilaginibacter corticis]|uniref:DUF4396 domain-containing protein n=1 Tax=Mucilaginibacter corticis TaxID=2597670 RepID=A0A556MX87_9SPHI|nr:DUF4396 domain-containing protein [Mucilaginibacter corticis]TSJ44502.1 DUF4396 domain-containing protein [Mucilaginibacter corticis]